MSKTTFGSELIGRLQQLTDGLKVGRVNGDRVLVSVVKPRTDMDRAKERGIIIPEYAEKVNTPLPSTAVIVKVGDVAAAKGWQEGEAIMFSPYMGSSVTESGMKDKYRILETREILCTLEAVGEDIAAVINIEEAA